MVATAQRPKFAVAPIAPRRDPDDGLTYCGVAGCPNRHLAQGYCSTHFKRIERTGEVGASVPIERHIVGGTICKTPGCGKRTVEQVGRYQKRGAQGYCRDCYRRRQRAEEIRAREAAKPPIIFQ